MSKYLNFKDPKEQSLIENLINESLHIHCEDFLYIPRRLFSPDDILGEDRLSKFDHAYHIPGYMENPQGFDENQYLIERFGLTANFTATVTISRRDWAKLIAQWGTTIIPNRPAEGDLLYYNPGGDRTAIGDQDMLFEIKFVDAFAPMAQLGGFYTFKLTVGLFQYASEQISTGDSEIDAFETLKTFDQANERSEFAGVQRVIIEDGGSGYNVPPQLTVKTETGVAAELEAVLDSDGSICDVRILDCGQYYSIHDTNIIVAGNCITPAVLTCEIGASVERAGGQWGTNKQAGEIAEDIVQDFDRYNPMGQLDIVKE